MRLSSCGSKQEQRDACKHYQPPPFVTNPHRRPFVLGCEYVAYSVPRIAAAAAAAVVAVGHRTRWSYYYLLAVPPRLAKPASWVPGFLGAASDK